MSPEELKRIEDDALRGIGASGEATLRLVRHMLCGDHVVSYGDGFAAGDEHGRRKERERAADELEETGRLVVRRELLERMAHMEWPVGLCGCCSEFDNLRGHADDCELAALLGAGGGE